MQGQFRDPTALARPVIVSIYAWMAAHALYGAASGAQAAVVSGLAADTPLGFAQTAPELEMTDTLITISGLLALVAFAVSGYLILRWIHRVNANAQAVASGMSVSPRWNIGWFFVPIANLWKPFQGVRETWQVSHSPADWRSAPVPALLRWWWACWLIMSFIDNTSFRLSLRMQSAADLLQISQLDVASALVAMPLGFLLVRLVRQLTRAQSEVLSGAVFA